VSEPARHDAVVDSPRAVRAGEEIDAERLASYLAAHTSIAGPLTIEQFPSGYSNLTYLVRTGQAEYVLRRPPVGVKISTAHDMAREHRVLQGLSRVWPRVPRPVAYCEDPSVLGAPFFVMERVRGLILRKLPPPGLTLGADGWRALSCAAVDTLAEIHGIDPTAAGLTELGRPEGYVARQVKGWTERWNKSRTDEVPEMEQLAAWLEAHRPAEAAAALVHNDFKYDNLVLDPAEPSRVLAVLDWEMATLGDPLMDLGTTLGYWAEPDDPPAWREQALGPSHLPGNLTRAEVVERYARKSGREVRQPVFYFGFGLLKLAVIGQQIYARWRRGLSTDERFAALIDTVRSCGRLALQAIDADRIDRLG
jgi:aminoglycoside phosphotransferase (APT) family kinase protein